MVYSGLDEPCVNISVLPIQYENPIHISESFSRPPSLYTINIWILRWSIGLGRIDILTEVSCLSQHLAEPRDGRLVAVYKIFKYLDVCLKKDKWPKFGIYRLSDSICLDQKLETSNTSQLPKLMGNGTESYIWCLSFGTGQHSRR